MPIYEYNCRKCQHPFWKVVQVSSSKEGPTCPKCGSRDLERLISRFNTRFYTEQAEEAGREMLKEMGQGQPVNLPDPDGEFS